MAYVLEKTKNLVILHCYFAEHGYEMCKDLKRMCTAIALLCLATFRCRRGSLSSLNALAGCF